MRSRQFRALLAILFGCVTLPSSRYLGALPLARPIIASLMSSDLGAPPPLHFHAKPVAPSVSAAILDRVDVEDDGDEVLLPGPIDPRLAGSPRDAGPLAHSPRWAVCLAQGVTTTRLRC